MDCESTPPRSKKGSGSFSLAWGGHLSGAAAGPWAGRSLGEGFDLLAEAVAAPGALLLSVQAQFGQFGFVKGVVDPGAVRGLAGVGVVAQSQVGAMRRKQRIGLA